jgi:hypothetical protein
MPVYSVHFIVAACYSWSLSIQQFVSFAATGLAAALGTQQDKQFERLQRCSL